VTERRLDYVEAYELDERKRKSRSVDDDCIDEVKARTPEAAETLRRGQLAAPSALKKCGSYYYRRMCTVRRATVL